METKIFLIGILVLAFICFIAFLLDLFISKLLSEFFKKIENKIRKKLGYKKIV